jgi:hypothetical protein
MDNGEKNPQFVQEIKDPKRTHEGFNFTPEFIKQKNDEGYNCYWFPNHPSRDIYAEGVVSMAGKHVDVFNFVFIDMDLKDGIYATKEEFLAKLAKFPVKPSMVVDSGNGIHAYWNIQGLTRDEYVYANLALLKYFNTDESVFTVLQLMRLPDTNNTKKFGNYIPATILTNHSSGTTYSLSEFPQDIFHSLTEKDIKRGRAHLDRLDGKLSVNAVELVNIDEVPDMFFDFLNDPKNKESLSIWMNPKGPPFNDRSRNDFSLANSIYRAGFNRKEALAILSNTQKALNHADRKRYAELMVDKIYAQKLNTKFLTVGQRNRMGNINQNLGDLVRCSWWVDTSVLGEPWRKRELTGLIAGPGVGKTSVLLKWIKDTIENNPDNDDIYVVFSLEMSVGSIQKRWNKLVGENSPLADRLYVIANKTEDTGERRNIGLQEILEDCNELKKLTGKKIGMMAIDHLAIISQRIDCTKKYTFGIDSEINAGFGNVKALSMNKLCDQLKPLAEMIDTHIVVLTQTTKEKGVGDLPIGKDGAYGISNYENIMDRIITVWQPLQLVQSQTKIKFMAWQYVKIREKSEKDTIQVNEAKVMTFDLATGDIRPSTTEEYAEFVRLYPMTIQMREEQSKKKGGVGYSIHLGVDSLNKMKASLGLVPNTGDNSGLGKVQPNQHSRIN